MRYEFGLDSITNVYVEAIESGRQVIVTLFRQDIDNAIKIELGDLDTVRLIDALQGCVKFATKEK
jgi:hypothetical protein